MKNIEQDTKKSILFSHKDVGDMDRGGICVIFKTLASGLSMQNWNVHVVTTRDLSIDGVETHRLAYIEDPGEYSKSVTSVIEAINPNIVESSNWRFELLDYAYSGKRLAKVIVRADPCASTLFSNVDSLVRGERALCQKADLIIAVSNFAKKDIESKYGVGGVRVVHNGIVDTRSYSTNEVINSGEILLLVTGESKPIQNIPIEKIVQAGKINIMWIGKPTKMKGFDLLEKIVNDAPDNINFIINMGYAPTEVEWNPKSYQKCTFIRALTKQDQLSILRKTNIFLSTSTVEGFGFVVAEALNEGLPVILNKNCVTYKEFLPNDAVTMINMNNPGDVIESIYNNANTKVLFSRNQSKFTQLHMVDNSIKYYKSVI